ncbi:MAG: sigma-70 family RNA polymerase sigma factor [Oscillospiraceae bacterium]
MPVTLGPRSEFIEKNLGLVHSCATRFRGRGIEYDDLFSAGCMGIVKAYDGFDEGRGLCFSTYAVPVILGEIKKLFRDGGTVKVSRSIKELGLKVTYLREKYLKMNGTEPTISYIADKLSVSLEQVADAISASMPALSLTPVSDEDGNREFDIPQESCEETLADLISLRTVLSALAPKDRQLIYLRFFNNKTQSETARILGTTQVQISRKERKLLDKLRHSLAE